MGKVYEKAKPAVLELLERVIYEHHDKLAGERVHVDVLMVSDDSDEDGALPMLMHHGYPAAATIRVVPLPQRALGQGDALMMIDEARWGRLTSEEREALIDHELMHLAIVEKNGVAQRDDMKRPKLQLRLHDWQLGGFVDVAKRYRSAALEVQMVKRLQMPSGQYVWDFDEPKPSKLKLPKGTQMEVVVGGEKYAVGESP